MSGEGRNAELSRAAILAAAGGGLVAMSQNVPELTASPFGKAAFVIGAIVVVVGLALAIRSFFPRSGGR